MGMFILFRNVRRGYTNGFFVDAGRSKSPSPIFDVVQNEVFFYPFEEHTVTKAGEAQMKHVRQEARSQESMIDKAALLEALADTDHPFTKNELEEIINNEFFNDDNPLDTDLVDAVVARMLLLEGTTLDEAVMQQGRERMIYGMLKKMLKPKK